jgi:hypothetical protein
MAVLAAGEVVQLLPHVARGVRTSPADQGVTVEQAITHLATDLEQLLQLVFQGRRRGPPQGGGGGFTTGAAG